MKVRLSAGAEFDVLTQEELQSTLEGFKKELLSGVKYTKFNAQVTCDGTGAIGDPNRGDTSLGPRPGYLWSVRRLVAVLSNGSGGSIALFANGNQTSDIVYPSQLFPAIFMFASESWIIYPGENIIVQVTGAPANAVITLVGQCEEVSLEEVGKL